MEPDVVTTETKLRSEAHEAKSLEIRLVAADWHPEERDEVTVESWAEAVAAKARRARLRESMIYCAERCAETRDTSRDEVSEGGRGFEGAASALSLNAREGGAISQAKSSKGPSLM